MSRSRTTAQEHLIAPPREIASVPSVPSVASTVGHPHGGPFIPQMTYGPYAANNRRVYVDDVQLEAHIMFFSTNPTGCGILLKDAISSRFSILEARDDAMFQGKGPSVSIRLNVR